LGGGPEVALAEDVEHHDGDLVVHAKGEGGGIHDLEPAPKGIAVGDRLEPLGAGIGPGIRIIDAVHLGGFEEGIGSDFAGAEGSCGVGGEERMSCAGGEDDHTAFFEVTEGPAADERFGHVFHFDGGEDAGFDSSLFEGVLKSERVNDRGEHAHIVGGVAVHLTFVGGGGAPPDVASADDDSELEGGREDFFDLVGEATDHRMGEMIRGIAQGFAGKFEEKPAGFFRVGGGIGVVSGTFPFARTAERGRERTGGFRRGFF